MQITVLELLCFCLKHILAQCCVLVISGKGIGLIFVGSFICFISVLFFILFFILVYLPFRYSPDMDKYFIGRSIDKVYLDNTYCHPLFCFPPRVCTFVFFSGLLCVILTLSIYIIIFKYIANKKHITIFYLINRIDNNCSCFS